MTNGIKMKKRTSLALILAGSIGLGITAKIESNVHARYMTAISNIPVEVLESKKELDEMTEKNVTPYQILEKVFEIEEGEKRFRDLYQKVKEYNSNPQILAARGEMEKLCVYSSLGGALCVISTFSLIGGITIIALDYQKKRRKEGEE